METEARRAPDRRQRKSRAALQQALLQLVASKPYDAVTIDDVTTEADVARATFYAHYKDKSALLLEAGGVLISEVTGRVAQQAAMASATYTGEAVRAVFEHAAEHRHLYRLIIVGEGGAAVRAELIAAFEAATFSALTRVAAEEGRTPRGPVAHTATAFVGALLRTIETWIDADLPVTAATITADFMQLQAGGLEWALGFEPGETHLVAAPQAGA